MSSLTLTSVPVVVLMAGVVCDAVGLLDNDFGFVGMWTRLVATRLICADMLTGVLCCAELNPL